jgi:hypothetical protein
MADGTEKNIEDVEVGEMVMSYNELTHELTPNRVLFSFPYYIASKIVDIYLSDGTYIGLTPSHPLLTTDGWKSLDPIIAF